METAGQRIDVEIETVTFRNEETGWTVVRAFEFEARRHFIASGTFLTVGPGQGFQLFGNWTKHPQYGPQFKVDRALQLRPTAPHAIQRFLASGLFPGVGKKIAEKIVSKFGKDTLEVLDNAPQRLKEVPKLGKKTIKSITEAWTANRASNDIMLFLGNHNISPLYAKKIVGLYGGDSLNTVTKDPYQLAYDIKGIGFKSADKIALSMGFVADAPERVRAAVAYQLRMAEENGHCFQEFGQMLAQVTELLGIGAESAGPKIYDALNVLADRNIVKTENMTRTDGSKLVAHFLRHTYLAEKKIAESLTKLLRSAIEVDQQLASSWLEKIVAENKLQLSMEQLDAVQCAIASRVFILTGGPGVGKTTTANTIIKLFRALGKSVALGAPTGRAAQRLSEVSSLPAKTIHRLLEWSPDAGGFVRNETDPLKAQVVIVDEASMLDVYLAEALFSAVSPTAQLVIIGDVDQLPSVGPGSVLGDLLQSKCIPFRKLDKVFRQAEASAIIRNAHAINRGLMPQFDNQTDCRFVDSELPAQVVTNVRKIFTDFIPNICKLNPVTEVQLLTPMNKGDLGTQALNELLQVDLNPPGPQKAEFKRGNSVFRDGDKVIQTVNNYELNVFNGDIGFIQHCSTSESKIYVRFGDRLVAFSNEQILDLRLAYAITIHKSQGSEFPVVVIPIHMQQYVMLQRNLVYTALTRGKKLVFFVGLKKALFFAVQNQASNQRQTTLLHRLTCQSGLS